MELKYDADGAIIIDDDDDDELVVTPATDLPKIEKPLSTAARQALVPPPPPSPSPEAAPVEDVSS